MWIIFFIQTVKHLTGSHTHCPSIQMLSFTSKNTVWSLAKTLCADWKLNYEQSVTCNDTSHDEILY